jgi:hypothetical protein
MLDADDQGLLIDGPVWLGGDLPARAAGERLAALLPAEDPAPEPQSLASPRSRGRRERGGSRRRLLVPAAIVVALLGAGAALLMPSRSAGTQPVPASDVITGAAEPDVLLGEIVGTVPTVGEPAPRPVPAPPPATPATADPPRTHTETVIVTVAVESSPPPAPEVALPELPADEVVIDLPAAVDDRVPVLGGW